MYFDTYILTLDAKRALLILNQLGIRIIPGLLHWRKLLMAEYPIQCLCFSNPFSSIPRKKTQGVKT